jgi:hypothetical protein
MGEQVHAPAPYPRYNGPQKWYGLGGEEYCHYINGDVSMENGVRFAVLWVVTPSNIVGGYRRFGVICCLHLEV